ncbi:hypothetical protein ACFLTU_01315 [Bacteroidota bacterium]
MVLSISFPTIAAVTIPGENDRIGWSADGNLADEDDWAATALALAVFAKMDWQDKLVHFDYNNRLDRSHEWKEAENYESVIGGARRFRFNEEFFFDDQRELEAAIEHAKEEINKSHEGSKFWYVQAGPFEVAYQALLRADPEKRQYCILVSHAPINEKADKWKLEDGSASHGKDDCVALGAGYFFTTMQGKDRFGGRSFKRWDLVEWMKNSSCEEYQWVHSRFMETAKHKDGGLDASDGGMAFVLATGDLDGNFSPKLRDFLGTSWAKSVNESREVSLIVDSKDAVANAEASKWAMDQLRETLKIKGVRSNVYSKLEDAAAADLCVLVSGSTNKMALELLEKQSLTIPETSEALGLVQGEIDSHSVLLACGHDPRGLVYALLELADRMNCGANPVEALKVPEPVIEKPAVKVRSIYRTFTSEVEDKAWYNDRLFWKNYLTELATQRVNRFSLSLGMGYNTPRGVTDSYFLIAYPFLVDVPGYDVYAVGLPDKERDSNLEMLKFISDEAAKRGIEFQLALWSHGKDWENSEAANYLYHGLTDENHAKYCRDGLEMILKACPSITGITFRVHYESGIPKGSEDFWKVLFQAFPKAGRPVWIDMHGKHITQGQITAALATGMPVSVSPKYWGEHQGLAYHQADIRSREKGRVEFVEPASGVFLDSRTYTRYGYGDLLPEDREWEVLHRIWPGTQRLLLSGDPALAAGYGNVSGFSGSLGVERLDPLTFKGRRGSGYPGGRCAYVDKSLEPQWDFQKFLYSYRIWGRLVYNPDTDPEVWQRFLRKEFQEAAEAVEIALANSSRVLNLITTAHSPSADCKVYWPEIYNNQPIVEQESITDPPYRDTDMPPVFGNVSPLDPQLFSKMNEYAAALLEDVNLAKYSPLEVAHWLDDMADISSLNLAKAESLVNDKTNVEFRRLQADVKIQCGIARFFAEKMRSAVLWHLYEGSGDINSLSKAIGKYTAAREIWAVMAEEAKSIYVSDISFGELVPLRGHWADRIPAMDEDIANMKEVLANANAKGISADKTEMISEAIRTVDTPPQRLIANCSHTPADLFKPGEPMKIEMSLEEGKATEVNLYYRHVNQAVNWQVIRMKKKGKNYQAVIPDQYTETRYPMEYYFAIDMGKAGIAIYPGLDENLANMPYYVVRQKR